MVTGFTFAAVLQLRSNAKGLATALCQQVNKSFSFLSSSMKYRAHVTVMPIAEILDPQGKAVLLGLKNLAISGVQDVRVGKHITLDLVANDEAHATELVDTACKKLLANLIMEDYQFTLQQLD